MNDLVFLILAGCYVISGKDIFLAKNDLMMFRVNSFVTDLSIKTRNLGCAVTAEIIESKHED